MLKSEALCGRYKQHGRPGPPDEVSTTNALLNDIHKLASTYAAENGPTKAASISISNY